FQDIFPNNFGPLLYSDKIIEDTIEFRPYLAVLSPVKSSMIRNGEIYSRRIGYIDSHEDSQVDLTFDENMNVIEGEIYLNYDTQFKVLEAEPERSIELVETIDASTDNIESNNFLPSFQKRSDEIYTNGYSEGNNDCPIAVIADHTFYRRWGDKSQDVVLSLMSEANNITVRDLNLGLPLKYIYIAKESNFTLLGDDNSTDVFALVSAFKNSIANNLFPDFVNTGYCGVVGLTSRYLNGYIGLYGPNFQQTSLVNVSISSCIQSNARRLLGAPHDPNTQECNPNGFQYIMATNTRWIIALNTINGQKYSPCSIRNITGNLQNFACLVPRGTVPSLTQSNSFTDFWFPHLEDQCHTMESIGFIPALTNDSWTDNVSWDINSNGCNLVCTKKSMGSLNSTTFPDPRNTSTILKLRDGTPCDDSDWSKVCISGVCTSRHWDAARAMMYVMELMNVIANLDLGCQEPGAGVIPMATFVAVFVEAGTIMDACEQKVCGNDTVCVLVSGEAFCVNKDEGLEAWKKQPVTSTSNFITYEATLMTIKSSTYPTGSWTEQGSGASGGGSSQEGSSNSSWIIIVSSSTGGALVLVCGIAAIVYTAKKRKQRDLRRNTLEIISERNISRSNRNLLHAGRR
ncbi:hypothetical protein O9G_005861, partial [Rozella allomycis CSF55]